MTVGTAVVVVGVLVDVGVGVGTLRGGAGRGALSVTLRDAGVSTLVPSVVGWVARVVCSPSEVDQGQLWVRLMSPLVCFVVEAGTVRAVCYVGQSLLV